METKIMFLILIFLGVMVLRTLLREGAKSFISWVFALACTLEVIICTLFLIRG